MSSSQVNDDGRLPPIRELIGSSIRLRVPLPRFTQRTSDVSRPRASKAFIEAIPKVMVASDEEGNECCICLDGLKVGNEAKELPCKHMFHGNCIEKWLATSNLCPLCRFSLPTESEEDENSDYVHYDMISRLRNFRNAFESEDDSYFRNLMSRLSLMIQPS